ncbi:hypothetical protein KFE25_011209 [Diacronema lutheri]|uniref:Protein YIPF n=2 Tax=Diacronema lutheri TaxID=2081491 RepID=A0A8J5XG14_DIALT|nr:hypothetical protein KFE25_011209 [Diacronema lutheri]
MPASRGQGGMPGAAPLRSVIDFGADGAAAGPAAGAAGACVPTRTHSIESGLHHRSGSVGGGVGGSMGGGIGGASAAVHDGGLAFYAAEPQAAAAAAAYAGGAQPGRPQGLPMPAAGGMMGRGGGNGCAAGAYGGPTGQMSTAGAMPIKALGGSTFSSTGAFLGEGFDDEPPILEELGINLAHIAAKTKAVLKPYGGRTSVPAEFLQDSDLAGPLGFCLVLGTVLLLKGKVSFGSIYGCGAVGCGGMYAVLNLLSHTGINIYRTVSILGYCLLPIIALAALSTALDVRGPLGYALIPAAVLWSTNAAALFFVVLLGLDDQRWLVAYPVMLFYAVFALISVF